MGKTITITGQKGGSGKSCVAVNLSASLAILEKKTLLIDCDPQANATIWSGILPHKPLYSLTSVFSGKCGIGLAIQPTQLKYLDVIPSDYNLMFMAAKLSENQQNLKILKLLLKEVVDDYEFVIIDPPSSYHFMSLMALMTAQCLIVTVSPDTYAKKELTGLGKTIKHVQKTYEIRLPIARFLGNRFRSYETMTDLWGTQFPSIVDALMFKQFIPDDPAVQQACSAGVPVAVYDFKSPAAAAYMGVAKETTVF